MEAIIRPSAALQNKYTKNSIDDTALMGIQGYNQMTAELELLRTLADAEEDIAQGRVAPVQETFDDIRSALLARVAES